MASLFTSLAVLAQTAPPGQAPGAPQQPSMIPMLVMFAMMGLVMWLFILRPQQRRQKEREAQLNSIKTGDRVITTGGIEGVVTKAEADVLRVRIAPSVEINVRRAYIAELPDRVVPPGKEAKAKGEGTP